MGDGKYFHIESQMNDMVLDVEGCSSDPGTRVVTYPRHGDPANNQLFYEHLATGTIRSKMNDFCLDTTGSCLTLNPYQPGDDNQQWELDHHESVVRNRSDPGRVLDITAENSDPCSEVCAYSFHGNSNQRWNFPYQPAEYFYIVSEQNGKVMDVKGADSSDGANVIIYDRNDSQDANQLWYEGPGGTIRSKLNDFAIDSADDHLEMQPYDRHRPTCQWVFSDNLIINALDQGVAADIKGASDDNETEVIPYSLHGEANQQWRREYV